MVCLGSKTLRRKASPQQHFVELHDMPWQEGAPEKQEMRRMKKIGSKRGNAGSVDCDNPKHTGGGKNTDSSRRRDRKDGGKNNKKSSRSSNKNDFSGKGNECLGTRAMQPTILRKKVDPETAKYFMEISNLFENNEVDLDERSCVCANALGEARGKEVELATDMIISRTLQTLLEGCDLHQLCSFLQNSAKDFSSIAIDKNGSHVAETALKSLAVHLEDEEALPMIENVLTKICQAVVFDSVNIMSSSYGSHVIRSLLCLCRGMPLDSLEEFHVTKASVILSERLNVESSSLTSKKSSGYSQGFPDLLKFLIKEMLKHAGDEIKTLRINKYSSFVLQTSLKLLIGEEHELIQTILTILGCSEDVKDGLFLGSANRQEIMDLMKDNSSSHLVEVILEVAPEKLFHEILEKFFKGSLFEISLHHSGNYVIQALLSSSRCKDQADMLWNELCPKIKELLANGKTGVVASLLAACQRFESHNHECCEFLASSICADSEHPNGIVPHLLFLDNYLSCKDSSNWNWPAGVKMNILGCLMLQTIFKYSKKFMDPYILSMLSISSDQILDIAKDPGGRRALESFLGSDALPKQKIGVISKLQGHFGELSLHPSGSFTVEKCFTTSDILLKESIVSELACVKDTLSKMKHGPYIIGKLDIDRYVMHPKHWKSSQATKEAVFRDFHSAFTSEGRDDADTSHTNRAKRNKRSKYMLLQNDGFIDNSNTHAQSDTQSLGDRVKRTKFDASCVEKHGRHMGEAAGRIERQGRKFLGSSTENSFLRHGKRKTFASELSERNQPKKRKSSASELADLAGKGILNAGEFRKLFKGTADQVRQNSVKTHKF